MPKAHSLFRLSQKLYLTPHLINQQSFSSIESYVNSRNAGMMMPVQDAPDDTEDETPDDLDDISGIGVIEIYGPLTAKDTGWESLCGGTSYEGILDQCDEMLEKGCSTIVLDINSGGGEALGVFECADTLRARCDAAGVQLIAYNSGCTASAAYAIACCADEVISNKFAETGSIGVLICLTDRSKQLEQEGVKPIFVTAGKEKIPYADDGSFRKEFLDDLQGKVDYLYEAFVGHVASYTGMSVQQIKDTEARTFMAEEAMSIGLINKVMSSSEFVDYIVTKQQGVQSA